MSFFSSVKHMMQEGLEYVEVHALPELTLQRLAIRILTNIDNMWDKYLNDLKNGVPNAMPYQEESLSANLINDPI